MAHPETRIGRLPGDRDLDTASMLRVDQAGEYGAVRIYAGQLAVLGNRHISATEIARMKAQEQRHLDIFDSMLTARRVRPTLMGPVWHAAGYLLGAATALMGPRAAMACTAAVETEIGRHYAEQAAALGDSDPQLKARIEEFAEEEDEHRRSAIEHGAEQTPFYPLLSAAIRAGCRAAIAISKRV